MQCPYYKNFGLFHVINDYLISTSAQLNPKPKMLCCPRSEQHSILGFGFNYDHLLTNFRWYL